MLTNKHKMTPVPTALRNTLRMKCRMFRRGGIGTSTAIRLLVGLGALLTISFHASAEGPFSNIIVFGGPLEDMGNFSSVHGPLPAPFVGNRFTNGTLAVEILAQRLGLTLKPSMHRVGPVKGNNFASADGEAFGDRPQDLGGQMNAYFATTGNRCDPQAFYYLIIGGNDVIKGTKDRANAEKIITAAVQAKEAAIRRLVNAGAKTILVANFINLGITPQIRLAGLSQAGTEVSELHNKLMEEMLDKVEKDANVVLIRDDFGGLANEIYKAAPMLGFTNTTDSCMSLLPDGKCDPDHFLFINDLFPTRKFHEMWGNQLILEVLKRNFAGPAVKAKGRPST